MLVLRFLKNVGLVVHWITYQVNALAMLTMLILILIVIVIITITEVFLLVHTEVDVEAAEVAEVEDM